MLDQIKAKAEKMDIQEIGQAALNMCATEDAAESLVFEVFMEILEARLPESRFLELCEQIETILDRAEA